MCLAQIFTVCIASSDILAFIPFLTEPGLGRNSWWCPCRELKQHSVQLEQMAEMNLCHLYFPLPRFLLITISAEMLLFRLQEVSVMWRGIGMLFYSSVTFSEGFSNRLFKFIEELSSTQRKVVRTVLGLEGQT